MAKVGKEISSTIKTIYWLLIGNFLAIAIMIFSDSTQGLLRTVFPFLWLTLFLLGAILLYLTIKSKLKGALRKFLILAGLSSSSFLLFVVLHNFFYALAELSKNIAVLPFVMNVFEVASFLIAIIICPLGFLIGVIGGAFSFRGKE